MALALSNRAWRYGPGMYGKLLAALPASPGKSELQDRLKRYFNPEEWVTTGGAPFTQWLAQYPPPVPDEADPYDVLGVGRMEHLDEYRAKGEHPPYIPRIRVDRALDEALLSANRFIILTGRAKSGKSRTAFEAVRRNFADHVMLIPQHPSLLPNIFQNFDELASSCSDAVVWLDDLERFLTVGSLTVSLLGQCQQKHSSMVVVATLRSTEFDKLNGGQGEIGRSAREVLDRATNIHLDDGLTSEELAIAQGMYSDYPDLDFTISVGEAFVAAKKLKARFDNSPGVCPQGAAVVRAAIDCRRIGVTQHISRRWLEALWTHYFAEIEPLKDVTSESFDEGLRWARTPVAHFAALLVKDKKSEEKFQVPDYLVEYVDARGSQIPPLLWDFAAENYIEISTDLNGVGYMAWFRQLREKAKDIWQKGVSVGDAEAAYNLGRLLQEDGKREEAKTAYAESIALGYGGAAHNLGLLLAEEDKREEAEVAFTQGMALGHGGAAFNLGLLLAREGKREEAKAAYAQGIALGDGNAASNLGLLLVEEDKRDEAKVAFTQGMALGYYGAAHNLGLLLAEEGKREEAKAAYAQGIALGHGGAAFNFGLLLAEEGKREEAKAAYAQGMALGHGSAAFNLGVLLAEDGKREEAKAAYAKGIALGHGGAATNLGVLLAEEDNREEAKAAFERDIALGDGDSA